MRRHAAAFFLPTIQPPPTLVLEIHAGGEAGSRAIGEFCDLTHV
jgi:hypothetical protein